MNKSISRNYIAYLLFILLPLVLVFVQDQNSPIYYKFAKSYGVVSLSLLFLQIILSSRNKLLDKFFGYPKIMKWHSFNAKLTFLFILAHPILIIISYLGEFSMRIEDLQTIITFPLVFGVVALIGISITVFAAIYSNKLKLKYEVWKLFHKLTYVFIVFVLVHALMLGSDFGQRNVVFYYLLFLLLISFIFMIDRHLHIFGKKYYKYVVNDVRKLTSSVYSYHLSPIESNNKMNYSPGQFVFTKIQSLIVPDEEHHFTISNYSDDGEVVLTIKKSGDYTNELPKIKIGTEIRLEGPYGKMSVNPLKPPYVFIAAGIGITPAFSNLQYLKKESKLKNTTLIISNKKEKDIIFSKEISLMKTKGLKYYAFLTQEKKKYFYEGRIDQKNLSRIIKGKKNANFFVTGGKEFVEDIGGMLRKLKIQSDHIHTETFSLK